jgi:hypothetical protein
MGSVVQCLLSKHKALFHTLVLKINKKDEN